MKFHKIFFPLLIALFSCHISFSQEREMTQAQLDFAYATYTKVGQELVKKPGQCFKLNELEHYDPKAPLSVGVNEIDMMLDTIMKNGKLTLAKKEGKRSEIVFTSNFTEPEGEENIGENMKIEYAKHDLSNSKGEAVDLQFITHAFISLNLDGNWTDGEMKIEQSNELPTKPEAAEGISGSITYSVKFITGHESIRLTKKDIGSTILLGGRSFEVLDLYENKIILNPLEEEKVETFKNMTVNNLDPSGQKVYMPYPLISFDDSETKDKKCEDEWSNISSQFTINRDLYHFFRKNPEAGIEDVKAEFPPEKFTVNKDLNNYLVITTYAAIQYEIILSLPVREIERNFTAHIP